jgi:hypothetical protein
MILARVPICRSLSCSLLMESATPLARVFVVLDPFLPHGATQR